MAMAPSAADPGSPFSPVCFWVLEHPSPAVQSAMFCSGLADGVGGLADDMPSLLEYYTPEDLEDVQRVTLIAAWTDGRLLRSLEVW